MKTRFEQKQKSQLAGGCVAKCCECCRQCSLRTKSSTAIPCSRKPRPKPDPAPGCSTIYAASTAAGVGGAAAVGGAAGLVLSQFAKWFRGQALE